MNDFLNLLEELCSIPGPSGFDAAVRDAVERLAAPYASEMRRLPLGGLLVFKKGAQSGKTVMFDAHMDEVGFIITGIREDGLARFDALGGVNTAVAMSRRVLCSGCLGVIGGKAGEGLSGDEHMAPAPVDTMYIDFGFDSREEAEKHIAPGDPVTFDSDFVRFGDHRVKAKALDDRAGCALLLDLMRKDLPYDAWFSFSTFEEIGGAGAKTAAFAVQPDYAVVVEATTAADIGGVPYENQVCRQQKGAAISFMDRSTIYPPDLYRAVLRLAEEKGIAVQPKEGVFGGNNAGSIHPAASGVRCVAVSLPCRYIHSGSSVLHEDDLRAASELLLALDELLGKGL